MLVQSTSAIAFDQLSAGVAVSKFSSEPYKIFEFGRIDLSQDDVRSIPKIHLRFIGQSCLAANDISVFLKFLIGHMQQEDCAPAISELAVLTTIIIQRNLQSKIFEFIKIVGDYQEICVKKRNADLGEVLEEISNCIADIKEHKCYAFTKHVRNKITNHYAFEDWHAGASEHKQGHKFALYMHKVNGNTFYPFAEEASHLSLFGSPTWGDIGHTEVFEWMAETNKKLISLQQKIALRVFKKYVRNFHMKRDLAFVPDRLVFDENVRFPLLSLMEGTGRW